MLEKGADVVVGSHGDAEKETEETEREEKRPYMVIILDIQERKATGHYDDRGGDVDGEGQLQPMKITQSEVNQCKLEWPKQWFEGWSLAAEIQKRKEESKCMTITINKPPKRERKTSDIIESIQNEIWKRLLKE